MERVTTRPACADDAEFAFVVKRAAFRGYADRAFGWDDQEQRELHERRFASQDFEVVRWGRRDVGVMAVVRGPDGFKLNQLFILPEYQGRGVGAAVMARLLGEARSVELPVRLQVLHVNARAIAFYERLGFARTGRTETHALMESVP